MKNIKDELQHIILGDGPTGQTSQLKKVQYLLRSNAETSLGIKKQQRLKSEEAAALVAFTEQENIIYAPVIRNMILSAKAQNKRSTGSMGRMLLRPTQVSFTNPGLITSTVCSFTIIFSRPPLIPFWVSK